MARIRRRPECIAFERAGGEATALLRPVAETSVGKLEQTEPFDARPNVPLDLVLARLVELQQRRQVQLREYRRRRLLQAAMRILNEIAEPVLEVDRRDARHFERRRERARQAVRHDVRRPCLTRLNRRGPRRRHRHRGAAHVDVDVAGCAVRARDRCELHVTAAESVRRLQAQHGEFLLRPDECDLGGSSAIRLEPRVRRN